MGLFKREQQRPTPVQNPDPVMNHIWQDVDRVILETVTTSAATSAAYLRKYTQGLDREFPGYRDDLNKRRAAVGLEPI